MLKNVELKQEVAKEDYKAMMSDLELRLSALQRQCKVAGIPVMIIMDGLEASGKGVQISKLMKALDPRGFRVYSIKEDTKEEAAHPFLWKYWLETPAEGEIVILDSSWYRKVSVEIFDKTITNYDMPLYLEEIRCFERQLTDAGVCIVKLFLFIDEKEQKKRMDKLQEAKYTAWRVTKDDLRKNKKFKAYQMLVEEMLEATNTLNAPWNVIGAMDRRYATIQIYKTVIHALEEQLKAYNRERILAEHKNPILDTIEADSNSLSEKEDQEANKEANEDRGGILQNVDLAPFLEEEEYDEKLEKLQKKIQKLHGELYRKKIPMILGFEGWDAGGKGGAIKRLTEKMDPRGYVVNPVCSPNDIERVHHYLWRFWKEVPKAGHIAIFDRTWYGRVMVERIEGFCSQEEWERAYKEINDMEASFVNAGAIVLKFWLQIDKDEQEKRFRVRQETPEKQWKITDEDWRNRAKWDEYERAVNEMIERTSTKESPWIIVEGNDKKYARIKVLETVVKAMEERLN